MKFYSYTPDKNDNEPCGTEGKMIFELKSLRGAINRCNITGRPYKLYTYTNFYDDKTFQLIAWKG